MLTGCIRCILMLIHASYEVLISLSILEIDSCQYIAKIHVLLGYGININILRLTYILNGGNAVYMYNIARST